MDQSFDWYADEVFHLRADVAKVSCIDLPGGLRDAWVAEQWTQARLLPGQEVEQPHGKHDVRPLRRQRAVCDHLVRQVPRRDRLDEAHLQAEGRRVATVQAQTCVLQLRLVSFEDKLGKVDEQ